MANLDQRIAEEAQRAQNGEAEQLGKVWLPRTSLKQLIEEDRVYIAGTDNALPFEIRYRDNEGTEQTEVWTPPDAYRQSFFRSARWSGLLDLQ